MLILLLQLIITRIINMLMITFKTIVLIIMMIILEIVGNLL